MDNKEKEIFVFKFVGDDKKIYCIDLPISVKEISVKKFGNKIPSKKELDDFIGDIGDNTILKQLNDPYIKETFEDCIIGFRISEPLKTKLYDFLNTKPMSQVEIFMKEYFETKDSYLSSEGILKISDYLINKCSRLEVKDLVGSLINGGIDMYSVNLD